MSVKKDSAGSTSEAAPRAIAGGFGGFLNALVHLPTFEALHYREFRLLWLGQAFMSMGTWMDQVARGWLIYELTNSPLQLGLVRGIQAIPILLLSPIAGSAADRYDRKMQVMVSQILDGFMYALVAVLILSGRIEPWHVYVTAFGMAAVSTFQHPSRAAMLSDAVPPGHLTNAIGLNSVIFNVCRSTGPALAGVLIAVFGTGGSYAAQAFFYLLATVATIPLRSQSPSSAAAHGRRGRESFGRSIIEGFQYGWRNQNVRSALFITGFASLFIIPFTTLLPVFARDILGVGSTGQGLLLTGMGLGALCSAVLVASVGDRLPRGLLMLGGVTCYGLSVVAFAASPWFKLSLMVMMIVGLFHVSSHALVQTVIQAYSTNEFRGRTMSIFQQSHFILILGSMLVGSLASVLGAQWAVALMGTAGAFSIVAIYVWMPAARLIR